MFRVQVDEPPRSQDRCGKQNGGTFFPRSFGISRSDLLALEDGERSLLFLVPGVPPCGTRRRSRAFVAFEIFAFVAADITRFFSFFLSTRYGGLNPISSAETHVPT